MTTRSGRNILKRRRTNKCRQPVEGDRDITTPKDRHPKKQAVIKSALSQSSEQYPGDIIDPVAYANRSAEERRRKSAEEGKIARPLNSYMLYRKAYQQVARRILSNDQQQFASQIVGESWNRWEPDDVKAQFKNLAKIDHKKHHEAFPDYKYTPAQSKMSKASPAAKELSLIAQRPDQQRSVLEPEFQSNKLHDAHTPVCSQQWSCPETWRQGTRELSYPLGKELEAYDDYYMHIPCGITYLDVPQTTKLYDRAIFSYNTREKATAVGTTFETLDTGSYIDPALLPSCAEPNSHPYSAESLEWIRQRVPDAISAPVPLYTDYPRTMPQ